MNVCSKLEYLSLAGLFSLFKCVQVRLEPTRLNHFSGDPLYYRLLVVQAIGLQTIVTIGI
jgi:hypothetical protein